MAAWADQLTEAIRRWEQGKLDEAVVGLRELVVSGPPEAVPQASHLLAYVLEDCGDLQGARAAHRSVIESGDPVVGQRSAISLGMLLIDAAEWGAAHRTLSAASAGADPDLAALADTALALVLEELGDLAGAQEALQRARECSNPELAAFAAEMMPSGVVSSGSLAARELFQRAERLLEQDHAAAAEAIFRRLLTCGDPDIVSRAMHRLFTAYAEREEFEAARAVAEHAIAVVPDDHPLTALNHKLLGSVLVDLGEYALARAAHGRAGEDPRPEVRLPALLEEAKVAAHLGDDEGALALIQRVAVSGHEQYALEAHACLGQVYAEAGDVAASVGAWSVVLGAEQCEYASVGLHFLAILLDQVEVGSAGYQAVVSLLQNTLSHADPDVAFRARLLLEQALLRQPLADPVAEQALQDADEGLALLRAGDLGGARRLLRRATDSEAPTHAARAAISLAWLELAEGDVDQADELLTHVAEGEDLIEGFKAAVCLELLRSSGDEPHPVLQALMDHQRLGRDQGLSRYSAVVDGADPAAAALARVFLAQVLVASGLDASKATELFAASIESDEPLALSYAALTQHELLLNQGEAGAAIAALRRADDHGHPALAPWVACKLGDLLVEHGSPAAARAAFEQVLDSEHSALRLEAQSRLLGVLEAEGDLQAACAVYEQIISAGDPLRGPRSAWLLGFTLVRLDDLTAAQTAFAQVPEAHAEVGPAGAFARRLLDQDFEAAAEALAQVGDAENESLQTMATRLLIEAADAWERRSDPTAADRALSLAVDHGDPSFVQEALLRRGALRNDAGDRHDAIAMWERAAAGPDEELAARAACWIGEALRALEDLDGAADWYRRAMADRDMAARAASGLAGILIRAGDVAAAREALEQVADLDPAAEFAVALRDVNDRGIALELYDVVVKDADPIVTAFGAFNLSQVLDRTGDVPGALTVGERALEAARQAGEQELAAQAAYHLGDVLSRVGHVRDAGKAFELAAASGVPGVNARARDRLGIATLEERAYLLAEAGDAAGASAALTAHYGSPLVAELIMALYADELESVRPLLEKLTGSEHAAVACSAVWGAALEHEDTGEGGGHRELLNLVMEFGDPVLSAKARGSLATLIAADGDLATAEGLTRQAIECGDPEVVGIGWYNIGAWREQRGDIAGAVEANRRALGSGHPRVVATVARVLATQLKESGDVAEAAAVLTRGAESDDPGALQCIQDLMTLLTTQGDTDGATAAAQRAIATGDPETAGFGYWVLAGLHEASGDTESALRMFRNAIEAGHPEVVPNVRADLARLLLELGNTAAAGEELEHALGSASQRAVVDAGGRLGFLRYQEGDLEGAVVAFGKAAAVQVDAEADPQLAERVEIALGNIAAIAEEAHKSGAHHVAARALLTATELGARPDAVALAGEFAADGDLASVRLFCDGVAGDWFLEIELADLLAAHGDRAGARAIYERLRGSDEPDVRFVAGGRLMTILKELGDDEAMYALVAEQADDAANPARSVLGSMLGLMQSERGDTAQALGTLREAAEDGEPMALYTLAQTLDGAGEVAEAREVFQRIVDGPDPEFAERAMLALGATYHDEDEELARKWYLCAVGAKDRHVAALSAMYLGALAKRHRDFAAALPWYQRVIDSGDPTETPLAAAHLGELCYWLGDRDGAVRYYELTLATTDKAELVGEAAQRLGEIRFRDGDLTAARDLLTRAVDTGDRTFAPLACELLDDLGTR